MPRRSTGRTARSLLALLAAGLTLSLLIGWSTPVAAGPQRSNYALNVILNDRQTGEIDVVLQLEQITGNSSYLYWAENMTANLTLGPQLAWIANGTGGGSTLQWKNNVSGTAYFNYTTYISSSMRENMTNNSTATFFATFTAVVVYTDNTGSNPWTIRRVVSFVLNYVPAGYVPPGPAPLVSLLAAAALGVGGASAVGAVVYVRRRARLDELYLMHDSGMLIRHWSRAGENAHDSDILSGMLIVLQEFVRDTWRTHQDEDAPLEQLRFGPQRVLMARGSHTVLAAVVRGRYVNGLPTRLSSAVRDFERVNADRLADWNGNVDVFPKVDLIAQQFLGSHSRAAM